MAQNKEHPKKIQDYLMVLAVRENLHRQLRDRQEHMAVSIKEAAKIVDIDEKKLRSWEDGKLSERPPHGNNSAHRRYHMREVARLLIIKDLLVDQQYSRPEVAAFLQQEPELIDELLDDIIPAQKDYERQRNAPERLLWAEEAFFWSVFVSRSLYLAMCLLFEQIPDNTAWLLLPLSVTNIQAAKNGQQSRDSLSNLGEVLQGGYSKREPFFACITDKPDADLSKRYNAMQLEWPLVTDRSPVSAHLLLHERDEKHRKKKGDYALKGAGKILRLLQDTQSQWRPYLRDNSDFMIYNAPEFEGALMGNNIMNKIANQIVQLGGMNAAQQLRWSFCCILLPSIDDVRRVRVKQRRHLLVQGQSSASPYDVNQTELSPDENSISMRAYSGGQITYRANIVDDEPDIALHEQEKESKSAIALPIEGKNQQPIGALYVASHEEDAFAEKDDWLILRLMGRIVAEQLVTYQSRSSLTDKLPDLVAQPQIVDSSFKGFSLESDCMKQLESWLGQIKPVYHAAMLPDDALASSPALSSDVEMPSDDEFLPSQGLIPADMKQFSDSEPSLSHGLASIAIDFSIDDSGFDTNVKISEKAIKIKEYVRDIGTRMKKWPKIKEGFIEMYYMYEERYCILLKNVSLEQAISYACDLQEMLHKFIDTRLHRGGASGNVQATDFHFHLGVVGYTYTQLQGQLAKPLVDAGVVRAKIMRLLDNALRESRDTRENIVIWYPQDEKFVHCDKSFITNGDLSLLNNKDFIKQVANEVSKQVTNEVFDRLKNERQQPPEH